MSILQERGFRVALSYNFESPRVGNSAFVEAPAKGAAILDNARGRIWSGFFARLHSVILHEKSIGTRN